MVLHDGGNDVAEFGPSLVKLGRSLLSSSSDDGPSSATTTTTTTTASDRTTCIVTLLRVLDNILADDDDDCAATTTNDVIGDGMMTKKKKNARIRKIKVDGPFYNRAGKYDGTVDFLVICGFVLSSGGQLRLLDENEDTSRLLAGRSELVKFASGTLGLSESHWTDCPYRTKNNAVIDIKASAPAPAPASASTTASGTEEAGGGGHAEGEDDDRESDTAAPINRSGEEGGRKQRKKEGGLSGLSYGSASPATETAATATPNETIAISFVPLSNNDAVPTISNASETTTTTMAESALPQDQPSSFSFSKDEKKEVEETTDDLLDEIEMELNDQNSFFLDYNNEGEGNHTEAVTDTADTANQSNNPIRSLCDHENDNNATEEGITVAQQRRETAASLSSVKSSTIRLEQSKRRASMDEDEDKNASMIDVHGNGDDCVTVVRRRGHETASRSMLGDIPATATEEGKQSQMQLPKMVEELLKTHPSADNDTIRDAGAESSDIIVEDSAVVGLRASDVLDHYLESENETVMNNDHGESILASPSSLLSPPPPSEIIDGSDNHDFYTHLFNDIPLPEGEFSSSDDDDNNEDVKKFRKGFKLCHRLLFSLWSEDVTVGRNGVNKRNGAELSLSSHIVDPTGGLANLNRYRQIWEADSEVEKSNDGNSAEKPVILVPLYVAYAAWACILQLNEDDNIIHNQNRESNSKGAAAAAAAAAAAGKMYSWVVSNHRYLSKFDDVPLIDKSTSSNHPVLPEASVAVCNYVCKSLRDIGLISIYSADTAVGEISESAELFVAVNEGNLFQEGMPRKKEDVIPALLLDDEALIRECHGSLSQLVCSRLREELEPTNNTDTSTKCNWVSWYSCQHAVMHLMASGRLEDAKFALSDVRFIRLRLQMMGLCGGTVAHCRDCSRLDWLMSHSLDEWRTKHLRSTDIKRELSASSVDDQANYSSFACTTSAPDIKGWNNDHFKILTSISTVLREKAGELSTDSQFDIDESTRRNLQKDIGSAMQMIGECIGGIGVHCAQEMEHYEEALALKTKAYGADQKHESIADILFIMGCHHQRFYNFVFAQKCYEQALKIYKVTLGYEHTHVARVMHNIGIMYYAKKDNEVALKCLKKSLSIRLSQLGDTDLSVAESYGWVGKIHREKKVFSKALECFLCAHRIKVDILGKAHVDSAEVLHNIGIVYDDLGLHPQSLTSFRETLLIRLANVSGPYDIDAIIDVCDTLDCIANVYRVMGERQKALQFFEQCLKRRVRLVSATSLDKSQVSLLLQTYEDVIVLTKQQAKECENENEMLDRVGTLLIEMGSLYDHRLNKQDKALKYLQKALLIFQKTKDYKQIGNTLTLIGVIHVKKSANQKALKCFQDSLVMRIMHTKKKETADIAETMHNIGNCEAKEGRFEDSLRSYEEALQIKNKVLPKEQLSIAKTEHCMGLAMLQLGNLDTALEFFERSLKVRRALLENNHLDVSFSLHSMGKIFSHQHKVNHAITCLEEALEIKKSKLTDKHMSLAETRHLLGSLYMKRGDFAPVIPLLLSALVAYRGRQDCDVLKSDVLDLLGNAYAKTGDIDNAILSYEHSLKIKKVVLGTDSSPCSNVMMEIGRLKSLSNDVDGALVAFKEVKRIQRKIYGRDHLKNAELLIQVGLIQDRLNNHGLAHRCFEEALRMRRKLLDKNHRDVAEALVHVGRMHQCKNDHFNSLALFRDAIDIYRESDGDDTSEECDETRRLLGLSQIACGDTDSAMFTLEMCLDLRDKTFGSESEKWAEVAYDLGIAKSEAGLFEDAVALLDKFILLQRGFENSDERLSTALLSLGKIYLKQRRVDDAMACFEEALGIRKQKSDNELGVSEVLFQIGGVRESKKQYLESIVCYEESLKLRLSVSGEDEDTADIVFRIGEVRRIRGQHDLALQNFTLALDMYKCSVGETHLSVANAYHSLGYVCDAKNDVLKAMQNHKEGLSVRKIILGGDHVKVAASLDDIAGIYQQQHEHEKALRCLKEALRIRKLRLGNRDIEIGKTLFGMGIIFAAIGDNDNAVGCYNASLDISSSIGSHPKLEAQTLHQIGCLHAENCNYREALQNWRTCLSKYREGGLRDDHYMVACTLGNIEMAESALKG